MPQPRPPRIVHELTPAPKFLGREPELSCLRATWTKGFRGVVALVGLGGAGKTAIAAEFLHQLTSPHGTLPGADGIFVWSFYRDSDAGYCLKESLRYFLPAGRDRSEASGLGLLHQLHEAIACGGPHMIVLDGLERVQLAAASNDRFGRLEDPLLKNFLIRLASGDAPATVLVTSRFPLTDLAPFRGRGFELLEIGRMDELAAISLLRQRGVRGDLATLTKLVDASEGHALTLDHLGGLIGQLLGGDATRAPELTAAAQANEPLSQRLGKLLRSYERHLPTMELNLLSILCLFRACISTEQVVQLLLCSPMIHPQTARDLVDDMTRRLASKASDEHDLRDLARSVAETVESDVLLTPTAGPASDFRRDVASVCLDPFEQPDHDMISRAAELAGLYIGRELDAPDDRRPLDHGDRQRLADLCNRYVRLSEHPAMPYQKQSPALTKALMDVGYWDYPSRLADIHPSDLLRTFAEIEKRLRHLARKHLMLVAVRAVCRQYQEKAKLAGDLAHLKAEDIRQLIDTLIRRHLLLREADGALNVHPAVRDYFRQRVANQEAWHDMIRDQLVTLVGAPGTRYVEEKSSLDLVEEAIYHTLELDNTGEALALYENVLGGHPHLAWKLGEMARGMRILKMFPECPDRWAMAWHLRSLGELEEAFGMHTLSNFLADIRLLQGRLPEVAAVDDDHATAVAEFLMGATTRMPTTQMRCAVPLGQLLLFRGQFVAAQGAAAIQDLYGEFGWEGDRARCLLVMAQVAIQEGRYSQSRSHIESASSWIVHSGSMEHLCYLHSVRACLARRADDELAARRAIQDGLHVATQCGLGLLHIELLCEQARLCLKTGDLASAEHSAREAWKRATAANCQFSWGAADAGHLLGKLLAEQRPSAEARQILESTYSLRSRINHPQTELTQRLLQRYWK